MMARKKNLQPWLDYFGMLHTYEKNGFLEIAPEKHEAYITQPALLTLAGCDTENMKSDILRELRNVNRTVRRLRTYAAFRSTHGSEYMKRPFALNVVRDGEPHDLMYTIVITTRRRWWNLWMQRDHFDIVTYSYRKP